MQVDTVHTVFLFLVPICLTTISSIRFYPYLSGSGGVSVLTWLSGGCSVRRTSVRLGWEEAYSCGRGTTGCLRDHRSVLIYCYMAGGVIEV